MKKFLLTSIVCITQILHAQINLNNNNLVSNSGAYSSSHADIVNSFNNVKNAMSSVDNDYSKVTEYLPCNNIDSVRIEDSIYNCYAVDFKGLAFTNTFPIINWSWNFGDVRYSDSQNVTHTYARPGVKFVKLIVTDINGCQDSIIKVVIITQVNIRKRADTSLCGSSPVKMFATGGSNYSWSPAASLDDPNIPNPVATPLSTTTYNLTVSNPEGCINTASVRITVNSFPVVTKSNDTSVCQNSKVQLLAGGGVSYNWTPVNSLNNPKIANPIAKPLSTTFYKVKVTNLAGCSTIDSILVAIKPVPVITKSDDTGVCIDNTTVKLFVTGGISYSWSPSSTLDNTASATPVASPLSTTVYHVVITDSQLCNYDDSVKVTVHPLPTIYLSKLNDINCSIPATQLFASGAQDYIWTPSIGLNNTEISNPIASPIVSTTYNVIGKDINGCVNSGTISVNVDFSGRKVYGLPNSFTPNGDGLNDCFGIKYWGHVTELSFTIYNRFGEKIFYTNNPSVCWDGTYKGEPQTADVYVYIIKAKTDCGNIDSKGIVSLLR